MGTLLHDLRYTLRTLGRSPSFTIPVVASLSLAIGANVTAFGFVNALGLRSLPVREPDRLFQVHHAGDDGTFEGANYLWFAQVRDHARSAEAVFQVKRGLMRVVAGDYTESVHGQEVTGDYFEALGVAPLAGRLITREDQRETGSNRVAVISEAYWAGQFARDPSVLGSVIEIDGTVREIVGITPGTFFGLEAGRRVEVTVPMEGSRYGAAEWLTMPLFVRLAHGVAPRAAEAELSVLLQRYAAAAGVLPRDRDRMFHRVELRSAARGIGEMRERYLEPALTIWAIVGVVLLLACTNWAMLLLARGSARRRDLTIRLALGATRTRVAGQILLESVLLALAGGALGLFLASWAFELLGRVLPEHGLPVVLQLRPDLRVIGFTVALSVVTGMIFGVTPAWRSGRLAPDALRSRRVTADVRGSRFGSGLVILQVAMSLALVVVASLLTATLRNLRNQEIGFDGTGVMTIVVDAEDSGLEGEPLEVVHRQILQRIAAVPGVLNASLATIPPLSGNEDGKSITVPGSASESPADVIAQLNTVGPDYLATMGIPLLRGRGISDADTRGSPRVAVIGEGAARHYFPGTDPIGRRVRIGGASPAEVEIVGVAKDVMHRDLRTRPARMLYVPFFQRYAEGEYSIVVRTQGSADALGRQVQSLIHRVAPGLAVARVRSLDRVMDERLVSERALAAVSASFSLIALLVAGLGVLGVLTYSVSARTRELGVRMALGADRSRVLRLFLSQGMVLAAVGVVLGVALSLATTRTLGSRLYGIQPGDPLTLIAAGALLCGLALVASWIPARRASRVDPTVALQSD
jgi:predicted permease